MKNLSILLISLTIFFYSCSSNDDDTTTPPNVVQTSDTEPTTPTQYTLTVTAGEGGTVSTQGGTYDEGTEVTITATPDEGYLFFGWEGLSSEGNEISLSLDSNQSLVALFIKLNYTIEEKEILIDPSVADGSYVENIAMMFNQVNIPSTFNYTFNNQHYLIVAGQVCGAGECDDVENKDGVAPMPTFLFKYETSTGWNFIKSFPEAKTWNIRQFEKKGNFIVMGDGNEIGSEGWNGNAFIGEIIQDDIIWNKINTDNTMSYQHDISLGDVNGDNLMDVIIAPLNGVFINQSGFFSLTDQYSFFDASGIVDKINAGEFTKFCDSSEDCLNNMGLACQIDDLDSDGVNEIIFSGFNTLIFKKEGEIYRFNSRLDATTLYPEMEDGRDPFGSTMIDIEDFNNDGVLDMIISRERGNMRSDEDFHSFDVWLGNGDSTFNPHSVVKVYDDLPSREFKLMDVNNDGFLDVVLKANFGYYTYDGLNTDSGNDWDIYFREPEPKGVILNELIYINNGSGIFNQYDSKNLYVDGIKPYQIFPYMRNNKLHFMGFSYNPNPNLTPNNIDYKDGGVPIIFYDIEMDL